MIFEKISKEISSWSGVTSRPSRFGGIDFRLGTRQMGHLHGDTLADFPMPMQNQKQACWLSSAQLHFVLAQFGWIAN
jgi:hypothetical protein